MYLASSYCFFKRHAYTALYVVHNREHSSHRLNKFTTQTKTVQIKQCFINKQIYKTLLRNKFTKQMHKTLLQNFINKQIYKTNLQNKFTKQIYKTLLQNFITKQIHKTNLQNFITKQIYKTLH